MVGGGREFQEGGDIYIYLLLIHVDVWFYFIDYAKAFDCVDHNKLENSRDGNTRSSDLPLEKSVCKSVSNK